MLLYVLLWILFLSFSLYVFICVFYHPKIWGFQRGFTAWQADTLVALRSRLGNTCPMAKHGQTMFCFGILRYSSGKYKQYIYNQYLCLDHSTYDNPRNQNSQPDCQVHPQGVRVASCSSEEPWPNELLANWDLKSSLSNGSVSKPCTPGEHQNSW